MSLFNEREVLAAYEAEVRKKLKKAGLSRVRVKISGSIEYPQMKLDADNEEDLERAQKLFEK